MPVRRATFDDEVTIVEASHVRSRDQPTRRGTSGTEPAGQTGSAGFDLSVTELGRSREQRATYHRCERCGALWEDPAGAHPAVAATLPSDVTFP